MIPDRTAPGGTSDGLAISWLGQLDLERVLAAAQRHEMHRMGQDVPAWGEPGSSLAGADQPQDEPVADPELARSARVRVRRPEGQPADPLGQAVDPDGQGAAEAALAGRGQVLPLAALAGHGIMPPGPDLAGWLASAPAGELDDAALTTSITGWRKITSWAQAQELAAVAELARRRGVTGAAPRGDDAGVADRAGAGVPDGAGARDARSELDAEFAPNEVALALTLTQGGAEYWLDLAVSMAGRLPGTLASLQAGRIDLGRARLIDHLTRSLDDDLARKVEQRVLPRAERQTTGQLRASLQRAVLAADPAAAERRRREAERNARVELSGDHDGTASLGGRFLPAAQAAAAWARVCALAKTMEASGANGGADLLRAQVFTGLLLGTLPSAPPGSGSPGPHPGSDRPGPRPGSGGPGPHPGGGGPGPERGGGGPRSKPGRGGAGPEPGSGGRGPHPGGGGPGPQPGGRGAGPLPGTDCLEPGQGVPASRHPPRTEPGPWQGDGAPPAWPPLPGPGNLPGLMGRSDRPPGDPASGPRRGATPRCAGPDPPSKGHGERAWRASKGPPVGRAVLHVPWRTLAGLSTEPGRLSRIGPVTAEVARELAVSAAADPACAWRVVIVDGDGQAVAVTRIPGRRLRKIARSCPSAGPGDAGLGDAGPGVVARVSLTLPASLLEPGQLPSQLSQRGASLLPGILLATVEAAAAAIAGRGPVRRTGSDGPCAHPEAVPGYRVPDSLRALVEARDQTCRFPTCRRPAWLCDQDHTIPYREGGATCECNISADCRRHHRVKHHRGWRLSQPSPGFLIWTTPSGLTHTVTPSRYAS